MGLVLCFDAKIELEYSAKGDTVVRFAIARQRVLSLLREPIE